MKYLKHQLCLALDWLWWQCDMGTRRERVLERILGWLGWWDGEGDPMVSMPDDKVTVDLADL